MTSKKRRAVGYVRVSRVGGRSGDSFLSPDLQREQIESVARREGLAVVEVIEELDASGGDAERTGWNRALDMVESGAVDGIVVWNLARFSRSVKDALTALDRVESAGGRLWSATETLGDDPAGRMMRTVLLAVAENERDRAKAAFRDSASSAIERGVYIGARVPLGYVRGADRRLEVDPDAAPIVQGLYERRAKGMSWAKLAEWAGEQGFEMTDKGVFYLVHNPTYLGQVRWGDVALDEAHPALVSKTLWRKCQGKAKRSARTGKLTGQFLLQGVATCAACGRALYLSSGGRKRDNPFYYCRNPRCSERAYANARRLDDFVVTTVMEGSSHKVRSRATWPSLATTVRSRKPRLRSLTRAKTSTDFSLTRSSGNVFAVCTVCVACGRVMAQYSKPARGLVEAPAEGKAWAPPCPAVQRLRDCVLRPHSVLRADGWRVCTGDELGGSA